MERKTESKVEFDIQSFLRALTQKPGIYKMLDASAKVIYIGKAKNLKKRVSSYFGSKEAGPKQRVMVSHVRSIEVTMTRTEGEALLLESQFIKRYKPRYNICLRDDKSYPHIYVTTHQKFPRVGFHRGAKHQQGRYFGPYPSAGAVRESLKLLQKMFPVRQCEDSVFRNRSRPCLQYQINRCTAPCVDLIKQESYREDVDFTLMFLSGDGNRLINQLIKYMEQAANLLEYEKAARYRDQIATLRQVLEKQYVHGVRGDLDLIACASRLGLACVQVFYIRKGQHIGEKTFFPNLPDEDEPASVLKAFVPQYYLDRTVPHEIILSDEPENIGLLQEFLTTQAKRKVSVSTRVRAERKKWLEMAKTNAENALNSRLSHKQSLYGRFYSLREELGLNVQPKRLECFDISHMQGDQTVASCVVFDSNGPVKSDYRRFNISGVTPGDDYAAMAQAVERRFKRLNEGEHEKPDILFIDGGKGQIGAVEKVLQELAVTDVLLIGVSKGVDRKPGMEQFFCAGDTHAITISNDAPARLLIQHIRDEAHRFAITGHRQRARSVKRRSALESVEGLGPKRRQLLLKQFGGLREIKKAGVDALSSVDGISHRLAQRIYDTFHE